MNKKLLTIVGVAAVVGIGYYAWKSSKPKEGSTPKDEEQDALKKAIDEKYLSKLVVPKNKSIVSTTFGTYSYYEKSNIWVKKPNCAIDEVEQEQEGGILVCVKKRLPPQLPVNPIGGGYSDEYGGNDGGTYEAYEAPADGGRGRAFTGDTNTKSGSFFNPIRGRSQDTSF
jgi:hypothetical protein